MSKVKIKQNRFQISYKKNEVPKYEKIEQFLLDDLGVFTRADIYKKCISMIYNLRKKTNLENIWPMQQPKLSPIRMEMLKEISKSAKDNIQNTLNTIVESVYSNQKLRKHIFKRWFLRSLRTKKPSL